MPALIAMGLAGCAAPPKRELPHAIPPFSTLQGLSGGPGGWEELVMRPDLPRTDYGIVTVDGRRVLRASGRGASGLRCRFTAEPQATPWLRWSWRTREVPPGMCVDSGETDDSPARVAVAFQGDERRLSARDRGLYDLIQLITGERLPYATLMYVWDAQLPVGSVVGYARTSRISYFVVESGADRAGEWVAYERNLVDDFLRVFGEVPGPIASVGVMTDGDDLHMDLETWYGDIGLELEPSESHTAAATLAYAPGRL